MIEQYRIRVVFAVVVKTKHFLSDIFQNKKYPEVYDVKFSTSQVTNGACEIICYGKIKEKIK